MAVTPTIETPFEPALPELPTLPEVIEPDGIRKVLEEMIEYQHQLALSLRDFGRAVNADISLGHTVYPKTANAQVANVLEDGLAMEWDDPRAYAWAKINGVLRMLTNMPQGYIGYSSLIQNNGAGMPLWTFPQGGFASWWLIVISSALEGTVAHMTAGNIIHHLWHTTPTATQVQFYVEEADLSTGLVGVCSNTDVWVHATAFGDPK